SGALSYSNSSISPSTSSSSSGSAKSAVSECLGAWLNYLQIMNNLCAAGYRLAQTIAALEPWAYFEHPSTATAAAFITAWDELARASVMATSTVKSHIVSVLQDFKTQPLATVEQDSELLHIKEYNQLILQDNAQTMINLQHQFCVASCDAFAQLMCCYQCQTQVGFPHDPDCPMVQHPMSAAATIART
ncbi:AGAP012206-PA, partial [Anopheles gambiae str. PEST]